MGESNRALRLTVKVGGLGCIIAAVWAAVGGSGLGTRQIALGLVGYALLVGGDWLSSDDETRTGDAVQHLAIAALLGLLMVVIRDWRIEGVAFADRLAPIIFFGFLVHHSLRLSWRPTVFLLLSVTAITSIFGLANGGWMIAIGLGLVGLCHLPIPWWPRMGLVAAAGTTLAVMRGGGLEAPWPSAIWPILASLFMFRLVVYLYDLRHDNVPDSWPHRLSYFFLLPNPAFPLFPVVDAQTYFRQYYREDATKLYMRGVTWMTRGILHLLLYRVIYQELSMSAVDVQTGGQLALYLVTNFGLYLRISGQFHLAIGVLHLFGHGLPLTNNWYWLSSSFADLWRRINIYWKEFMQKVVFFPVFMKIRTWPLGETAAVVAASLVVFVTTWFLHSYQWFWILGTWLISGPDILFWSILAVLMTANTLWERRAGARKRLPGGLTVRDRVWLALRTVGVFSVMSVLWSLWNSPSIGQFFQLFGVVEWGRVEVWLWLVAYVGVAGLVFTIARTASDSGLTLGSPKTGFARQAATIGVGLAALAIAVRPAVTERLDVDTQVAFRAIRLGELNERDAELIRRGYYENLVGAGRLNSRAWEVGADRPEDWLFIQFTDAGRFTNDFFEKEFVPDASIVFHAAPFVTNQWGFRDQEYDREPSPDTYRVVMLGASYLLGSGVGNNENFEALVERRLNEDLPTGFRRYELLNFARPGFEPLRNAFLLPHALEFEPDAVWVFGYGAEDQAARTHLARMARNGIEIPDPFLRDIVEESGVIEGMGQDEASRLLAQYDDRLVAWAYETMLEAASARGIVPAWIFLPATESPAPERFYAEQAPFLESLGYRTVDLSRVFRGPPIQELQVAPWDGHPNVRGHQIIADSLYRALTADPALVGAGDESP